MTRAEIEAIQKSVATPGGECDLKDFDAVCTLAKEALELREALEWLDRHGNALNRFGYGYDDSHWELIYCDGNRVDGSTPLEAINNARRGM